MTPARFLMVTIILVPVNINSAHKYIDALDPVMQANVTTMTHIVSNCLNLARTLTILWLLSLSNLTERSLSNHAINKVIFIDGVVVGMVRPGCKLLQVGNYRNYGNQCGEEDLLYNYGNVKHKGAERSMSRGEEGRSTASERLKRFSVEHVATNNLTTYKSLSCQYDLCVNYSSLSYGFCLPPT